MAEKNENNIIIELVPSLRMFWIQNSGLIILYLVLVIMSGSDNNILSLTMLLMAGLLTLVLLYRYCFLCKLKWTITRKQLKTEWGVFTRDIHYVELYRVVDYCEKQSFMQMMFLWEAKQSALLEQVKNISVLFHGIHQRILKEW